MERFKQMITSDITIINENQDTDFEYLPSYHSYMAIVDLIKNLRLNIRINKNQEISVSLLGKKIAEIDKEDGIHILPENNFQSVINVFEQIQSLVREIIANIDKCIKHSTQSIAKFKIAESHLLRQYKNRKLTLMNIKNILISLKITTCVKIINYSIKYFEFEKLIEICEIYNGDPSIKFQIHKITSYAL